MGFPFKTVPFFVPTHISFVKGWYISPNKGMLPCQTAIKTTNVGIPDKYAVVPSMGSITQLMVSSSLSPGTTSSNSSPCTTCLGNALIIMLRIAISASRSAFDTKGESSLFTSTSKELRKYCTNISPPALAASIAISFILLSILNFPKNTCQIILYHCISMLIQNYSIF